MSQNDMVIGGIAVIRGSGDWTKSRVADNFNLLEADASFASLVSGGTKAAYDAENEHVTDGLVRADVIRDRCILVQEE